MPRLIINIGLTKKDFRDDQSIGVSVNVIGELDMALLAKPEELQAQISALFTRAETAISAAEKVRCTDDESLDQAAQGPLGIHRGSPVAPDEQGR